MAKHLFISQLLFILGGGLEIIRFLPQSNFLSGIALLFCVCLAPITIIFLSFTLPPLTIIVKCFHTFLGIFWNIFIQLCKTRFQTIYAKNSSGRWSAHILSAVEMVGWRDFYFIHLPWSLWIESIRHTLYSYVKGEHLHSPTRSFCLIHIFYADLLLKRKCLLQSFNALKHRFVKRFSFMRRNVFFVVESTSQFNIIDTAYCQIFTPPFSVYCIVIILI